MQEVLIDFVSRKYKVSQSHQSEVKLRYSLQIFCDNLSSRWRKSNRTLGNFTRRNVLWLQTVFKFSDESHSICSDGSASTSFASHTKQFYEVTDRYKYRCTQELRQSNSTEVILYAAKQKLNSEGSSDFAKVLDYLMKNPNDIAQIKAFCENKIETPLFSKDKCLTLYLGLNLSKQQYIELRKACIESGTNQWQSYYEIQKTKLECYPSKEKVTITETSACIELQALLDLTVNRLLKICEGNIGSHKNMTLLCKWGFDGASSQSTYKQKFQDENVSDNSVFMTSFVPIKLTSGADVVWINQNPSSTRYCRPIRYEFIHENAEITKKEYERMKEEIRNLTPTLYKDVIVNHKMLFTMIDGKVCTVLSNVASCSSCYLCGAKTE